jgi:hypothetical protein
VAKSGNFQPTIQPMILTELAPRVPRDLLHQICGRPGFG